MPLRLLASSLALAALAAGFAGCSLLGLGDDLDDLEPGTFRFRADGQTYTGTATYYPNADRPLAGASVILIAAGGTGGDSGASMVLESDVFLTASSGDRLAPDVWFTPFEGGSYGRRRGEVVVEGTGGGGVEGRFRFRLSDASIGGPIEGGDITADGAFRATLGEN